MPSTTTQPSAPTPLRHAPLTPPTAAATALTCASGAHSVPAVSLPAALAPAAPVNHLVTLGQGGMVANLPSLADCNGFWPKSVTGNFLTALTRMALAKENASRAAHRSMCKDYADAVNHLRRDLNRSPLSEADKDTLVALLGPEPPRRHDDSAVELTEYERAAVEIVGAEEREAYERRQWGRRFALAHGDDPDDRYVDPTQPRDDGFDKFGESI